ncbi:sucrose-phosphatase 2-like [Silene latifolia]|uniref:sucrose-phosphatase 2-like n=1 Tax=Silene latifolia TaxID=37657 RepID=UPI003D775D8B
MNRLNCAARLMLVSDLDYTMVDHDDPHNGALHRFNSLWEAYYRHDSLLVFSTGRSPTSYTKLRNEKPLLTPDITVMSVGTEIAYGDSMVPDYDWERSLNHKWDREIVTDETAKFPELVFQSETEQRPHKVSFFVDKAKAPQIINLLQARLVARGLDIKIIYSGGEALDVLPRGAGKGQALAYLLKKFQADDKYPINTLVCGDSGNDAELFTVPGVYGVMVSNAQEELLEWHAQNAKNNENIIHASERCAAGIMQAIGHFDLGPSSSPRDAIDLSQCMTENMNPGFEIVKFYLSCERWRRGDVTKSGDFFQNLKSHFHPSGIFVHPSGVQKCFDECLTALENSYGNEKGCGFWLWLDRISSAQIGSDTWLVKFDKWEQSGEERRCCLTTVLLNSKADGYTWMHIHQTWMNGYTADGPGNWLF